MTEKEVRDALARAVKKAYPHCRLASRLPYPGYWRAQTEYLVFHSGHVGDKLMHEFIEEVVRVAKNAEAAGLEPKPWIVSEEVKAIWRGVKKPEERKEVPEPAKVVDRVLLPPFGSSAVPMKQGVFL